MACYHPVLLRYNGVNPDSGKSNFIFVGTQGRHEKVWERRDPRDLLVPCRRCIGCRLDYSRRWADRLMLELDHTGKALFFTLTYDDEHLSPAMYDDKLDVMWSTLVKKDLQDFNKRLRYYFSDKEIRFYAVGEYGEQTLRPHYHGIYFGLDLLDFPDAEIKFYNNHYQPIFTSEKLSSIWKNGLCSIGNVSWQSCAYVARYNLKKLASGDDDSALSRNCLPEFSLMSRNPGIGGYFIDDHPEVFDNPRDKIVISDFNGVRPVGSVNLPSYIFNKLELVNPELYGIIKEEKKVAALDSFLFELSNTDLDEYEYLCLKESNHEKASKLLKRNLDC